MQLSTYLFFGGNCEEAFKFYEKLLGGKIEMMMAHDGSPAEGHVPPEWGKKILHARMVIGDCVLMASDAPPAGAPKQMAGFSVSLTLQDAVEGERIFRALEDGGTVQMPFQQTFWALRFGMLTDRFGVPWMINCEQPA
jgi:PhnB protein